MAQGLQCLHRNTLFKMTMMEAVRDAEYRLSFEKKITNCDELCFNQLE
jgi:hypothetical protein